MARNKSNGPNGGKPAASDSIATIQHAPTLGISRPGFIRGLPAKAKELVGDGLGQLPS